MIDLMLFIDFVLIILKINLNFCNKNFKFLQFFIINKLLGINLFTIFKISILINLKIINNGKN
jgi:hypothetical protein